MSHSPVSRAPSRAFIVVIFAISIVIGAVIAYLGIVGVIGAGIP
jgi:hypothetical protein